MSDEAHLVIEALWQRFVPLVRERIDAIAQFVGTVERGETPSESVVSAARYASHNLAGALGSYGRPDAGEAARLMQYAIDAGSRDAQRLGALLADLRSRLEP